MILIFDCIILVRLSVFKELKFDDIIRDLVYLIWELLDDDGGSLLIGYFVEKREVNRKIWIKVSFE